MDRKKFQPNDLLLVIALWLTNSVAITLSQTLFLLISLILDGQVLLSFLRELNSCKLVELLWLQQSYLSGNELKISLMATFLFS